MSLSVGGAFPWHTSYHYLPSQKSTSEEVRFVQVPESIWDDNLSVATNDMEHKSGEQITRNGNSKGKQKDQKFKENFYWGNLKTSRSNNPDTRQDDGVVLLVGIFNLLAVVVYAAQEFLSGDSKGKDKRVILWQVQKVLDELVLRVHSSETAADLISRALKSSARTSSGRNIDSNTVSSVVQEIFQEKDPLKLRTWLDDAKNRLIVELSEIPESALGPRLDPRIYRPLQELYHKITETTRRGRSFSSSLLQEASAVAKTVGTMSINELQTVLKVMNQLGRMQRRYDVLPMLKTILPLVFPENTVDKEQYPPKTLETEIVRLKRSAAFPPSRIMKKMIQRQNSRSPRLSDKQKVNSVNPKRNSISSPEKKVKEQPNTQDVFIKRHGIVESLEYDDFSGNWADKWFSLLTEISPIALDFTNLYSTSRSKPNCLRALLCKSNKYWRRRGTLHSAVTPFLSVIASWALEDSATHSLGDSLIAIRAGWMEKECFTIYPECQTLVKKPSSPNFDLIPSPSRPQNYNSPAADFLSKSGEVLSTEEDNNLLPTAKEDFYNLSPHDQLINQHNLNAQVYHSKLRSEAQPGQEPQPNVASQFELNAELDKYEEAQSNQIMDYNHYPNSHQNEKDDQTHPQYHLISNDHSNANLHPQQHLSQQYQNSHQHPQYFQLKDSLSNKLNLQPQHLLPDPSLIVHINPYSEMHSNSTEIKVNEPGNTIMSTNSEVVEKDLKKRYYERYDRPQNVDEMDDLVLSGSVSGMALQDRLMDRRKMLVVDGIDLNLPPAVDLTHEEPNQKYNSSKTKISQDLKRDYYSGTNTNKRTHIPPWAQEGAAAAFLNQPYYSNYMVSQKPAFVKPPTSPSAPLKPKKRPPVYYPTTESPLTSNAPGQIKYKYGVRRGLPAGNVDGKGLLESTDNELFSSSVKYKKKQVVLPQSLALASPKNKSSEINKPYEKRNNSSEISRPTAKSNNNSVIKPPTVKLNNSSEISRPTAKLNDNSEISRQPLKYKIKKTKKTSPPKPIMKFPTQAPSTTVRPIKRKDVDQFGPDDAITDERRNEILHQYVRDRQIRDVSS